MRRSGSACNAVMRFGNLDFAVSEDAGHMACSGRRRLPPTAQIADLLCIPLVDTFASEHEGAPGYILGTLVSSCDRETCFYVQ